MLAYWWTGLGPGTWVQGPGYPRAHFRSLVGRLVHGTVGYGVQGILKLVVVDRARASWSQGRVWLAICGLGLQDVGS